MDRKDATFAGKIGAAVPIEIKAVTESGEFEGYGSVFGVMDRGRDIVAAGAFMRSLAKRPAEKVKMLWQHRTDIVIGRWIEMREDAKGLYVKGKLITAVQQGRDCHELMKEGAIDGLSIGYRTIVDEYDRDADARRITEAELMEVSIVTFPMNEDATVSLVKQNGAIASPKEYEAHLRDAGLSRNQAKAFVAGGYKSLTNLRDAGDNGGETGILDALRGLRGSLT